MWNAGHPSLAWIVRIPRAEHECDGWAETLLEGRFLVPREQCLRENAAKAATVVGTMSLSRRNLAGFHPRG